ncbi:hypothetical protein [Bailinhaonella thermotolerans]|uniref:Uncharacterized protein n=1 Tax=Bailinhaonella thermotolerans TaxID=1070861 RepID=A0A3A4A2W4_9ACTN|nr:hypothetical protein [Bailinhaonella thermotolerans]RJL21050.1 hypothetical protein D5H75_38195 [Bailinhaonella thermotolerans]
MSRPSPPSSAKLIQLLDLGVETLEAYGRAELAAEDCEVIPAKGLSDEALTELGFTLGPVDPVDPLFREATLPRGWQRRLDPEDSRSVLVYDRAGQRRLRLWYKAAPYDRDARISIEYRP